MFRDFGRSFKRPLWALLMLNTQFHRGGFHDFLGFRMGPDSGGICPMGPCLAYGMYSKRIGFQIRVHARGP